MAADGLLPQRCVGGHGPRGCRPGAPRGAALMPGRRLRRRGPQHGQHVPLRNAGDIRARLAVYDRPDKLLFVSCDIMFHSFPMFILFQCRLSPRSLMAALLIVGPADISDGLDATIQTQYNVSITVTDVDALYTSPPKTFTINVKKISRDFTFQIALAPSVCAVSMVNFTISELTAPNTTIGSLSAIERSINDYPCFDFLSE